MKKISIITEPGRKQNQKIEVRHRPLKKPPRYDLRKDRNLPDVDIDHEDDPDLDVTAS